MFAKVMVPIDGSPPSVQCVDLVREMADRGLVGSVMLLTVLAPVFMPVDLPPVGMGFSPDADFYSRILPEIQEAQRHEGENLLERMVSRFAGSSVIPSARTVEGHPAGAILEAAKEGQFNLIVIGSRGLGGIGRFFLGSISDAVVHHAHCPVLVVR